MHLPGGLLGLHDRADRGGHRFRVAVPGDQPGPAAEQFDRVGEPGRDHGHAGRDRLDEDTGRGLVAGVVGQQHDVRRRHQVGELRGIEVPVVHRHGVLEPEVGDESLE